MISKNNCMGCQACGQACPTKAIYYKYSLWGERRAVIQTDKCIECGLCDKICPAIEKKENKLVETVYAIKSKKNSKTGSSGGVFFEIASGFINDGGVVYGAAFNSQLKLVHKKATNIQQLYALCKSKYIYSDMSGVYEDISNELKRGGRVMFVGTPCQTSAVKNLFEKKYQDNIVLVDFLCHGAGTQKVFDACISYEEKKKQGRIIEFNFRSKSRKSEHSFSYKIQKGKKVKTISGYSFEFPYYFSFLKYRIFDEKCYQCSYATNQRVGDITLGDFWGIQKYNKRLKDYKGVSMLALNTRKGRLVFEKIKNHCKIWEYPLACATAKNVSFNKAEKYPEKRDELVAILRDYGEEKLVEALRCNRIKKEIIYAKTPNIIKKLYASLKEKK